MNRIFIMLLVGVLLLSGCMNSNGKPSESSGSFDNSSQTDIPDNTVPTEPTATPETTAPTESAVTEPEPPQFSEVAVAEYDFDPQEFSNLFELEDGITSGTAEKIDMREGFSGSGYVTHLFGGGSVLLTIPIPASQHYNITLRAAAEAPARGNLLLNGSPRGSFELIGSGEYETMRFDNIYLPEGAAQLSFSDLSGEIDFDCVLIDNATEIYELTFEIGALTNPKADSNAVELYDYLLKNYREKVLSGQQVSQGTNVEIKAVYEATGRYPAIRFGELMDYSAGIDTGDIELASEWAKEGGIVGYSWYWPMNGSVYQNRTGFDLSNAVTDLDIVAMDGGALTLRYDSGDVTVETLAIIDGIDRVSEKLKILCDEGIPVIFRPLPEASNGQFWWSQSIESYLWLYKLIYERMTIYHGLNNLIWVWNGQSADWYVGDGMADIISLDIYYPQDSPSAGLSGINSMLAAHGISQSKMIAMSECSALPRPDNIAMDKAYWSYCSTWTGDYAVGGTYMQHVDWTQFYSSNIVLTRDEIEYNR